MIRTIGASVAVTVCFFYLGCGGLQIANASSGANSTPLTITVALSSATEGIAYSQALRAVGGTPAYTWSIASGSLPAGLTLAPSTGLISGTPISGGAAIFTASVHDSSNSAQALSTPITILVAPAPLKITASVLPSVVVGVAYSQGLKAVGGTAPYVWSIGSGHLPAGLTLTASTGAISGTPTASGTASFAGTVTDSSDPVQSAWMWTKIVVTPTPLAITPTVLPSVRVGAAYSQAMQASGGTMPYRWSVSSGKLPAGLSLASSTGRISGTPTSSGTANFTVAVTDSSTPNQTVASPLAVMVSATPFTITSSNLPTVTAGTAYSQTLKASGGNEPYSWSITAGKLPTGLTLAPSTGTISGMPTATGQFVFTTTAKDNSNPGQTASTATTLAVSSTTLTITTSSLPAMTKGAGYSQTLKASGGVAPYAWSITSGQLPSGLSISASTGVISGTPTSGGSSSFTATVTDRCSPAQAYAAGLTITGNAVPLTISSSSLISGTSGSFYSQSLQASGGTPAYTWSITSGSLPAGLTLAATTGTISGTPTTSGTSNFTATVTDNASPAQKQSVASSVTIAPIVATGAGATWYVRTDGGTRFSSNVTLGQCDGKSDVAYTGSGANQHCAFNDVRYLWMDGTYGNSVWVISGGDTVVIRGCAALPSQQNSDAPHCRIGWDKATGNDAQNFWCSGVGASWGCSMPPVPSGSSTAHTKIYGQCVLAGNCHSGNVTTKANLTQLFSGFGNSALMYLTGSQYVDVAGLELTTHNGACSRVGAPAYPAGCSTSIPVSDYTNQGITLDNTSSNVTMTDLYIHGFSNHGIGGPVGGPIALTRVFIGFNAFAGWNMDDANHDVNAPGATITQSYVTMEGNGCMEQYPIVNSTFPAVSCWDSSSGGFGDSWSGQNTNLSSFTCDHCSILYNTKDGALGPHTIVHYLSLTNTVWIGNMGQAQKWGQDTNATFIFQNNLQVGNCMRMGDILPGAAQNFNIGTGLGGSYLSNFCRAAGSLFAYFAGAGSTVNITNNSIVTYQPTIFQFGCYPAGTCGSTPYNITNNLILGYTAPMASYPNTNQPPAVYYTDGGPLDVVASHNIEYGTRNNDCAAAGGNICSDPLLVNEPAQGTVPPEAALDNFNFNPSANSPAIGAGVAIPGLTTDYYGTTRSTQPTIGAVGR